MRFPFPPTPTHLKKVKYFIYGALLLEFEIQYFHMFTNNTLNLELGVPFLPPSSPSKK